MPNLDAREFIFLVPIISLITIGVYFLKELFTPKELKVWWSRLKRRHLIQSVHPDNDKFDEL